MLAIVQVSARVYLGLQLPEDTTYISGPLWLGFGLREGINISELGTVIHRGSYNDVLVAMMKYAQAAGLLVPIDYDRHNATGDAWRS